MNTEIKIEKGVPPPLGRAKSHWPFGEMEVGDSFTVPASEGARLTAAASMYGKRLGKKFPTRRIGDDYRCWRTK